MMQIPRPAFEPTGKKAAPISMDHLNGVLPAAKVEELRIQAEEAKRLATADTTDFVKAYQADNLRRVAIELANRRAEALRLYEPLPEQFRFHKSKARIRLVRGSNRGGKTLAAAVEVARAVRGINDKFPKDNGRFFIVGKDQKHIAQVLWPKLSRAGAFKMIRDRVTGEWRAFRPLSSEDREREHEAKRAAPLIPQRIIQGIAWENKKEGLPNLVRLTNGWELNFYSSLGKPPQGSDIDGFWFDEEIVDPAWYPEMSARILDRNGRGLWSATPQAGTDQLFELHERAEKEYLEGVEDPGVEEFIIRLADNPHIGEKQKRDFASTLSPEEQRVRIDGDFAILGYKVYPEFSMHIHGVDHRPIPPHWTRYMAVDPGHQVCAVLFVAVPPSAEGDHVYLYDELYIKDCDAAKFARRVAEKAQHQDFEAFVIDAHMGIHTEVGYGRTVARQYTDALKAQNVRSRTTGSEFVFGSDDVLAGISAVKSLLSIRQDGTTKLRVLRDACPNFEWEIARYHRKRVAGVITDKPDQKRNNHSMDAIRYMAMLNPRYVPEREKKAKPHGAILAFREKMKKRRESSGRAVKLG